jgi:hypothetical protein
LVLGADSREDCSKIQTIADDLRFSGGLFDGTTRRGRSDSRLRHRPVRFVAECDGLEDSLCARTIGNASHLALGLRGRAGDKLRGQVSTEAGLHGFPSKRDLYFFKELLSLRLRKTNDQPGETRQ